MFCGVFCGVFYGLAYLLELAGSFAYSHVGL